ncbi:uncharacterized protein PgNI_00436 [Pyricularia grisea]|uniref:Uncharacterized protein n=1 Tax=Pyricularia grisea TaxID=148305 RepID=A0A6P8BHV0_PYRGI|nr:uncharacterized protein PgNI_00436 [Pyricularia grisea]TLD16353.1 hypothetical protein PgNI_00436 [Pyricularia grisea]
MPEPHGEPAVVDSGILDVRIGPDKRVWTQRAVDRTAGAREPELDDADRTDASAQSRGDVDSFTRMYTLTVG